MMRSDTIAAIATPLTSSGIGIIRISGEDAISVAEKIFVPGRKGKRLSDEASYTAHYGYIWDEEERIDEVILLIMRGPHSYTAEDTVEIDCHGGVLVMKRILETVLKQGARIAEPGEFTKRAFLNGRIDLSQAEAVMDVIHSKNEYALQASIRQLDGAMSDRVKALREKLIYEIAFIESALDDPEHISLDGYAEHLECILYTIKKELQQAISSFENGRIMTEGIKTVILGKPNAGKSSLMNVLLGEERAIVTDIAGTTRDTLEENVKLHGLSLNLIDTAGIRDTEDIVERIGVERARKIADEADLLIYVVDGSRPLDDNDVQIMELIRERKAIVLLNKTDLSPGLDEAKLKEMTGREVIPVSAKEQKGIDCLEQKIQEMFISGEIDFNDELIITNMRHKNAMESALKSLQLVEKSIEDQMPEDFYSIDLMDAYEQLGMILGESLEEDLVNEIFSHFCMGK
jgi:tRNA modification GTPase